MKKIADPFDVVAVIVSYNPGDEFPENVHAILEQVATVIIVDNGSESTSLLEKAAELPRVEVIYNAGNLGIANALNQGFERAISEGFEYVLTFDQDSRPMPWMV